MLSVFASLFILCNLLCVICVRCCCVLCLCTAAVHIFCALLCVVIVCNAGLCCVLCGSVCRVCYVVLRCVCGSVLRLWFCVAFVVPCCACRMMAVTIMRMMGVVVTR